MKLPIWGLPKARECFTKFLYGTQSKCDVLNLRLIQRRIRAKEEIRDPWQWQRCVAYSYLITGQCCPPK